MAYKSKLMEFCHKNSWHFPVYTTQKDGHDHCPSFTASVMVNGMPFQSPFPPSKSSKEAQNRAAQHALEYLSSAANNAPLPSTPPPPTLPQPDLHLYKGRIQHYTQKNSRSLPVYSYEFDGPPHARRFRARVTIDGVIYPKSEYYLTLKDAEHAAAKTVLESLLVEIPENEGLFKTLLQELAQNKGLPFPVFSSAKVPTFVSHVEVGGKIYAGKECKTMKQSEMSAAKVACYQLIEGEVDRRSISLSPDSYGKEPLESSSKFPMVQKNTVAEVGGGSKTSSSENHHQLPEAFPPPSTAQSGEATVGRDDESYQGSVELAENAEIFDDKWIWL